MILRRIQLGILIASLAGNVGLWRLYAEALEDTGRLRAEQQRDLALGANERLTHEVEQLRVAFSAREAELLSRLERSDQVASDARRRAEDADRELAEFRGLQEADLANPEYTNWAETKLPPGVTDRLRGL